MPVQSPPRFLCRVHRAIAMGELQYKFECSPAIIMPLRYSDAWKQKSSRVHTLTTAVSKPSIGVLFLNPSHD